MNTFTTSTLLASGFALSFGTAAQGAVWIGGGVDSEFSTAANWDDGLVPASGTTQDINGVFTVDRSVDSTAGRVFINGGAALNVTDGVHSSDIASASRYDFIGRGGQGTLNQTGGTYDVGHGLSIGGGGANGDGSYFLSGGTLNVSRGANSIIDSTNPNGRPSLEVSDEENAGSGLFEISGGNLVTRFAAGVGTTGVFSVVGSAATINIGNNTNGGGDWVQQTGGTLKAAIDAGGISTIFVNDLNAAADVVAEFKAGSVLDLGFAGIAPIAGTWTLLEAQGADIIDGGLGLSVATSSEWTFAIDNTGANGLLTATFTPIPEPASLALLAAGGILALGRRRKETACA